MMMITKKIQTKIMRKIIRKLRVTTTPKLLEIVRINPKVEEKRLYSK